MADLTQQLDKSILEKMDEQGIKSLDIAEITKMYGDIQLRKVAYMANLSNERNENRIIADTLKSLGKYPEAEERKRAHDAIVLEAFEDSPSRDEFEKLCAIAESERTDEVNHQIQMFLVKLLITHGPDFARLIALPGMWLLGRACKLRHNAPLSWDPQVRKAYFEKTLSEPIQTLEELCALPLKKSENL